ncbi:MAG: hypothetical protein JXR95_03710 [Deltaproteobacteria bacterium]|nr:hypothetical protein [Deltaproteobacteria bacterium]
MSENKDNDMKNSDLENEFFEEGEKEQAPLDFSFKPSWSKKWKRNPYVSIAVIFFSSVLIYLFFNDFIYGVKGLFNSSPTDIGDISRAIEKGTLKSNQFVKISGRPIIQSILPVPRGQKLFHPRTQKNASGYYLYFILQETENSVIVKMASDKPQFIGDIPTVHTGRVVKIDDVKEGARIQAFYKNNMKDLDQDILFNPMFMDKEKDPPRILEMYRKNKDNLKNNTGVFITDTSRVIKPHGDFKVDVKAYFEGDYILTFNRKKEISAEISVTSGTYKADVCNGQKGGDVIIERSLDIHSLPENESVTGNSHVEKTDPVKNPAADPLKSTEKPVVINHDKKATGNKPSVKDTAEKTSELRDKIIKVPYGTRILEMNSMTEIPFDKKGRMIIEGAKCNAKSVSLKLGMVWMPFAELPDVLYWLKLKNYPFSIPSELIANTYDGNEGDWEVIVRMPSEDAMAISAKSGIVKKCDSKIKGPGQCKYIYPEMYIRPRSAFIFNTEMRNISLQGESLVIAGTRTDFPKYLKETKRTFKYSQNGVRRTMTASVLEHEKLQSTYSLPLKSLRKFKFYPPVNIPSNAYVIVGNETPRSWGVLWKIPVVLILFLIMVFNFRAVFLHFFAKK